jgi:LPXTG-motif cell wall-anchored protein
LEDRLTGEELDLVEAKIGAAKGGEVITAVLDKTNGVIRVSCAADFDGDEDVFFDVTAYLIVDGEKYDDLGLTFTGTVIADEDAEPGDDVTSPAGPNPDTGDTSFLGIALAAMVISAVVAGVALLRRKR